jgi:DNA phosphorothioation-dependent restriction protein DptH
VIWTELHTNVLGKAFIKVLGKSTSGSMAFVRCLSPEVVEALAREEAFSPPGWQVRRVTDVADSSTRTITADQAVEIRENKSDAVLLLIDTTGAGAGMDGIYSAAHEINEASLFDVASRLAAGEVTRRHDRQTRQYAEQAIRKARGFGQRYSVSRWTEFDYLIRSAGSCEHPARILHLLGLWPVAPREEGDLPEDLDVSRSFVERLLGNSVAGLAPTQRIEALKLQGLTEEQRTDLEQLLRSASTKPLMLALEPLADKPDLWVNALNLEGGLLTIQSVELVPWRTTTGKLAKWSGLTEEGGPEDPPVLVLNPDADKTGDYSKLEVRWRSRPVNLEEGAVTYHVAILTDLDEEITSRDVSHSGKKDEKCRFTNDDFMMLSEDSLINAKVVLSVLGDHDVPSEESEEFVIRFGTTATEEGGGVGKKVRALSEGVIELDDREMVSALASSREAFSTDKKGYVVLRSAQRGKSYRVFRPPLIRDMEQQWIDDEGGIGRWQVRVRASGARVGHPQFVPIGPGDAASTGTRATAWERAVNASRRMAEHTEGSFGGVGQIYDQTNKTIDTITKEYLLAWSNLIDVADPSVALVHTIEVQSLSGRTIGLIVPPLHPLRMAWHVSYDNLVLHARYEQNATPAQIREELAALDGAMFPAFLPGLEDGQAFVFADTLGFHAVGLVPDRDKEPKAALAIMTRALGESESAETEPTVGQNSAEVLGQEILKYLECHNTPRLLHVHALRPGDGLTVARSLGKVQTRYRRLVSDDDSDDTEPESQPAFVLQLFPSEEQRGIAGRFIAEAREKRRTGAGRVADEDQWMLESLNLPGGTMLPRLRWARRNEATPKSAAHLAVAFDTFESRVVADPPDKNNAQRPYHVFGLLSFFERNYTGSPSPLWRSRLPVTTGGEKHPSDRFHTERLIRLQDVCQRAVARHLGAEDGRPGLRTEISPSKADDLRELHRLCDWVITLDRNAGIEYFDSPRYNREIYDAYVIDCVPEREDLGCLQLITSTANLEEVRNLLDHALDQMGLSRSRRNAEFLMEHLKALSGRLAIRLTGQKAATSELIGLALSHASCWNAPEGGDCWTSLTKGFLVPVDDIRDLLPPLSQADGQDGVLQGEQGAATRPDMIHVSVVPRKGLLFRFVEVKYRRYLRAARGPQVLETLKSQIEGMRRRWEEFYWADDGPSVFQAIRWAKLARVLRFYTDKANRHYLPDKEHRVIAEEIDRMVEKQADYTFAATEQPDRGWIFCPEYLGAEPLEITPPCWNTRVFLFGPGLLPDCIFGRGPIGLQPERHDSPEQESEVSDEAKGEAGQDAAEGESAKTPGKDGNPSDEADTELEAEAATRDTAASSIKSDPTVCLGTNSLTGSEVHWPLIIKGNPHLLVAGLPGMGKTTCLLNICKQMLDAHICPIVFSYHQDIDEKLSQLIDTVRFVDFRGLGFNPLQVVDRTAPMAHLDVAGAMRDVFTAIFTELGDIQGEEIRKAIKESFIEMGWGAAANDSTNLEEPPFARFVEILRSRPKPDRGLKTLLARLEELSDYGLFEPGESLASLWDSSDPIVIRIHGTQNDNLQKAFASLVFYGMYKDMFRRGPQDRITHALVFDEAHRAARLRLIPTMAKECRKYGISLVLASQEARDFNISLFSAIANYLVLRLTESDAKVLVRNVASSDQERLLIDKIKQMDRFKALYFCEGEKRAALVALRDELV